MGAEVRINVLDVKLSPARPVIGPGAKVAHQTFVIWRVGVLGGGGRLSGGGWLSGFGRMVRRLVGDAVAHVVWHIVLPVADIDLRVEGGAVWAVMLLNFPTALNTYLLSNLNYAKLFFPGFYQ